jgi:hypothetical protein
LTPPTVHKRKEKAMPREHTMINRYSCMVLSSLLLAREDTNHTLSKKVSLSLAAHPLFSASEPDSTTVWYLQIGPEVERIH